MVGPFETVVLVAAQNRHPVTTIFGIATVTRFSCPVCHVKKTIEISDLDWVYPVDVQRYRHSDQKGCSS